MKFSRAAIYAIVLSLTFTSNSLAQSHRGEVDSDGILSPGELRNPLIDYSRRGYREKGPLIYKPGYNWPASHQSRDKHQHDYRPEYRHHSEYEDRYRDSHFTGVLWNGIRSGNISRREEELLREREQELRRREEQYTRDGRISWSERKDLENRRSDLQDKLNHELNDGEKRWLAR